MRADPRLHERVLSFACLIDLLAVVVAPALGQSVVPLDLVDPSTSQTDLGEEPAVEGAQLGGAATGSPLDADPGNQLIRRSRKRDVPRPG
jgi:hypothetical protein